MRKSLLLLAGTMLMAASMMAQTSNSGNNNNSTTPPDPSGQPAPGAYPNSGQPATGVYTDTDSPKASTESSGQNGAQQNRAAQTVDGCIVRAETDYYLFPKSGEPLRLTGQDVSAHVNHHVKAHGIQQSAAGAGSAASSNTGRAAGGTDFVVDRIDMVSETCPDEIQKNIMTGAHAGSNTPQ